MLGLSKMHHTHTPTHLYIFKYLHLCTYCKQLHYEGNNPTTLATGLQKEIVYSFNFCNFAGWRHTSLKKQSTHTQNPTQTHIHTYVYTYMYKELEP